MGALNFARNLKPVEMRIPAMSDNKYTLQQGFICNFLIFFVFNDYTDP